MAETIQLAIISTIHSADQAEPEVIEQRFTAEWLRIGEEWQISYLEEIEGERSRVRLFAFADELIIIRQGPMSYRQVFQPGSITNCQMSIPTGVMEMEVGTNFYRRNDKNIYCKFCLFQAKIKLGTYQLQLTW